MKLFGYSLNYMGCSEIRMGDLVGEPKVNPHIAKARIQTGNYRIHAGHATFGIHFGIHFVKKESDYINLSLVLSRALGQIQFDNNSILCK
jgi:hypothetical protein